MTFLPSLFYLFSVLSLFLLIFSPQKRIVTFFLMSRPTELNFQMFPKDPHLISKCSSIQKTLAGLLLVLIAMSIEVWNMSKWIHHFIKRHFYLLGADDQFVLSFPSCSAFPQAWCYFLSLASWKCLLLRH